MCLMQLLTKESCRNVVSFYLHNVVSVSGTENNINIIIGSCGNSFLPKLNTVELGNKELSGRPKIVP